MSSWDNEKAPSKKVLLPEGWRGFDITSCEKTVSKSGNAMFKITLVDQELLASTDVYAIAVPGKRWFLKSLIEAVGIDKQEDDDYDYSPELLNQKVSGLVVHETNDYINRDGIEVKAKQHKIQEFKKHTSNPGGITDVSEVKWEQ